MQTFFLNTVVTSLFLLLIYFIPIGAIAQTPFSGDNNYNIDYNHMMENFSPPTSQPSHIPMPATQMNMPNQNFGNFAQPIQPQGQEEKTSSRYLPLFGHTSGDNFYISLGIGFITTANAEAIVNNTEAASINFDTGIGFSSALGYKVPDSSWNFEAEIAYRSNRGSVTSDNGIENALIEDLSSISFMLNTYYTFMENNNFSPYFGIGLGFARVGYTHVTGNNFAYQWILGADYDLSQGSQLYTVYKHLNVSLPSDNRSNRVTSDKYEPAHLEFGYRRTF